MTWATHLRELRGVWFRFLEAGDAAQAGDTARSSGSSSPAEDTRHSSISAGHQESQSPASGMRDLRDVLVLFYRLVLGDTRARAGKGADSRAGMIRLWKGLTSAKYARPTASRN